ncbi:hypothetical protein DEJ50_20610 [Streptomyces venezuelae]|uniref:Secreted protein n=1 Tax=Streptomyces venezuelae TaxID=54571 RepID=A0A5P2D3Z3_STRVZ|nr:hypothetical protein [Streptomyces venezuelae]QES49865.1 hypothetical protein DEJ50_20610 [Streptomyces venezuelae]
MNRHHRIALLASLTASALALGPVAAAAATGEATAVAAAPTGTCALVKGDLAANNRQTFDLKLSGWPRSSKVVISGPRGSETVRVASNGRFTDEDVKHGNYRVREDRRNAANVRCSSVPGPGQAQGKRANVSDVNAVVAIRSGNVKCPGFKMNASGEITTSTAGDVKYRWVRSDGAKSGVLTLNFPTAGTKSIPIFTYTPDPGAAPGDKLIGFAQVVIEGESETSNQSNFNLTCIA